MRQPWIKSLIIFFVGIIATFSVLKSNQIRSNLKPQQRLLLKDTFQRSENEYFGDLNARKLNLSPLPNDDQLGLVPVLDGVLVTNSTEMTLAKPGLRGVFSLTPRGATKKLGYIINRKVMSTVFAALSSILPNIDQGCDIEPTNITAKEFFHLAHGAGQNMKCWKFLLQSHDRRGPERNRPPFTASTTYMGIYRDPMDRLLSGWTERCFGKGWRCYSKCVKPVQIDCFIRYLYEDTFAFGREGVYKRNPRNFLPMDHFWPQNWALGLTPKSVSEENFVLFQYAPDRQARAQYKPMFQLMETFGIPKQNLDRWLNFVTDVKAYHNTENSPLKAEARRNLTTNPVTCRNFVKLFYYDYQIFNLTLPLCPPFD